MNENTTDSDSKAPTPEQNTYFSCIAATSPISSPHICSRYELQGVLATGGMGVVHKGWDHILKRPVAVKLLLKSSATPLVIKRFDYEAHITSQLQHPSIPPIHDMGTTVDGEPFLVMKLIKGRTLDDLIKNPGGEKLNVLGIFEAIAQAVGYAHNHAVIHRDLKPMNVMVGAFGEVQVMDWGLAKFRSDAEATTQEASVASTFYDPRTGEDSRTSAGAILGTPAYMPPEQAIGAIDDVNERSDVFGLGGILCTMLTRKPPFVGHEGESTRKLAAQGKVHDAFARLDASGAEPEVIALAKRCLAVEPAGRPANGYEVAKCVAKLRHDADERAKQAEIGKARSDTRRRVLAWSAATVFVVLTTGVGISAWQAKRAWDAEQATGQQLILTQAAEKAVGEQLLLTQAEERRAQAAETEAKKKTKEINETFENYKSVNRELGRASEELIKLHQSADEGLRLAKIKDEHDLADIIRNRSFEQAKIQRELSSIYYRLGDLILQLGLVKEARVFYQTALDMRQRLADANPKDFLAHIDLQDCLIRLGIMAQESKDFTSAIVLYEKALAVAAKFEKPELFPNNTVILQRGIAECRAKLSQSKNREVAPPAREAK